MVNQITKMRLPDGTEVAFVDWQDQPIYSTAYLLTGYTDENIFLFTYAPNDEVSKSSNITTGITSTERETNTSTAGSLNETEEMLVYAIKPEYSFYRTASDTPTSIATLSTDQTGLPMPSLTRLKVLHDALILQLWVSIKVHHQAGLGYYNTGFGPAGQGMMYPTATTTQRSFGASGWPSQDAVRSFAMPVYIGGGEKYRVTLWNPTNTGTGAVNFGINEADTPTIDTRSVCRLRVTLDGLHKRPVS